VPKNVGAKLLKLMVADTAVRCAAKRTNMTPSPLNAFLVRASALRTVRPERASDVATGHLKSPFMAKKHAGQ
jgi:hypothetical protein